MKPRLTNRIRRFSRTVVAGKGVYAGVSLQERFLFRTEKSSMRKWRNCTLRHLVQSHVLWLRCEVAQLLSWVRVPKPIAQQLFELFHKLLRFPTNELGHLAGVPRVMLPTNTLLQNSKPMSDTSDSRCHLEKRSAQPSQGSPASVSKPSVSRPRKLPAFVPSFPFGLFLGVCWGMILVNLHCSAGQVYKQALCVEFPSSVKSRLVENNTPRNHAPPDHLEGPSFPPTHTRARLA